jgi:hypothetical protein
MSVYYNRDITNREKDKRHHDLLAAPTWLGPASWTCYQGGQEGHSAKDAQKGGQQGRQPCPQLDPTLSAKVTTGSPDGRRGATSYGLTCPGLLSMLHFLASMLRILGVAMMAEKQKAIFLLDSRAHFSVLPFSPGPGPMTKVIIRGKSGQPLECYLLSLWPALWETFSSVILSS